jgi:RNA polymerase sigma factor (sigma-70 family)
MHLPATAPGGIPFAPLDFEGGRRQSQWVVPEAKSLHEAGQSMSSRPVRSTDPKLILNVQSFLEGKFSAVVSADELGEDWERFYSSYSRIINRFAVSCGMQDCDVEECSQEVWMAVVNGLPKFQHDPSRGRFRSWLYRIVSNKAADLVRERIRHSAVSLNDSGTGLELLDPTPPVTQNFEAAWRSELLREAMKVLQEKSRPRDYQIFVERTIRKKSASVVGRDHDMTEGAVRVVDHRLRQQLQDVLNTLTDGLMQAAFKTE